MILDVFTWQRRFKLGIQLRKYQESAIESFEKNNRKGILEMATGTGKTITALESINRHYRDNGRQFLVIIVPFLHLIDQWVKDFDLIGLKNYLTIANGKKNWHNDLKSQIWEFNMGFRNRVVLIGSYKSMGSEDFQMLISKVSDHRLLVADECHYIGTSTYKKTEFKHFDAALGLSATPRRWWDEAGSKRILDIFEEVVYEYTMEKAIDNAFLTPYYYFPKLVPLTEEEIGEYELFTIRIGKLVGQKHLTWEDQERLNKLLRRRAAILQKSEKKLPLLIRLIKEQENKKHTLVYCAPGEVNETVRAISDLGIKVHRFNAEVNNNERQILLSLFSRGEIEVLVAIKCLDEGVDVPATKNAYFLSSTSNPREFVQRRGRVLRLHEDKNSANIIDFITLQDGLKFNTFNSIAKREMPRFAEFSSLAINKYQEREPIRKLLAHYDLEMYLNIKPWKMYEILKKENGGNNETSSRYT